MADLYHYTSCEGFFGMLSEYDKETNPNLTMWATNVLFMNDASEYQFGQRVCKDLVMYYEAEEHIEDGFGYAYNDLDKFTKQDEQSYPCVVSLSTQPDNAAMWSMYSNSGKGMAIIFNQENLSRIENVFLEESWYCQTADDLLSNARIRSRIAHIYKHSLEMPHSGGVPNNVDPKSFYDIIHALSFQLEVSTKIKHASFKYEAEKRLIKLGVDTPLFRVKKGVIVPYKKILIPISAVKGFIIGPTANFEYMHKSLNLYLSSKGLNNLINKVTRSTVPYRG